MTDQRLRDLRELRQAIWTELQRGARERDHAWHTPVLATTEAEWPDARTVVLREVDAAAERVVVYTDARAGKVMQARANGNGMLVLWSATLGWQLRCRLHLHVHDDGLAVSSRWASVRLSRSASDYLAPLAPGAELGPTPVLDPPTRTDVIARSHFGVLEGAVVSIDWLELHPGGHRRARFDAQGARWLQP
jgi:pyridoxamine 5'-phosphate oxidase